MEKQIQFLDDLFGSIKPKKVKKSKATKEDTEDAKVKKGPSTS